MWPATHQRAEWRRNPSGEFRPLKVRLADDFSLYGTPQSLGVKQRRAMALKPTAPYRLANRTATRTVGVPLGGLKLTFCGPRGLNSRRFGAPGGPSNTLFEAWAMALRPLCDDERFGGHDMTHPQAAWSPGPQKVSNWSHWGPNLVPWDPPAGDEFAMNPALSEDHPESMSCASSTPSCSG